jgi:hypothetical protein
MLTTPGVAISRRGQWRGQVAVYSPGGTTDPTTCVYRLEMREPSSCGGYDDWRSYPRLQASSDDGTGRLLAVATDEGIVLAWLFSADETRGLCPGSYAVSVTATLADETAEIFSFSVVVQ